jgi:threonine efflux protein
MHEFLFFTLLYLGAKVSPGPNFFTISTTSLKYDYKAGIKAALGVASGCFLWLMAAAFGASEVFSKYPESKGYVSIVGGIYLLYLAYTTLKTDITVSLSAGKENQGHGFFFYFSRGFGSCVFNPELPLFYATIFTKLLDYHPNNAFAIYCYVGYFTFLCVSYFSLVAIMFDKIGHFFNKHKNKLTMSLGIMLFVIAIIFIKDGVKTLM